MRVLVGLPSFNNGALGYTIRQTLDALSVQSFNDFKLLIVYKPSSGDRTLDIVNEFTDRLDIEIKIQNDGFFEEAVNEILKASIDYDITLTTDDDAIPTRTWIEEHVKFHKNHEKVGVLSGMVILRSQNNGCYEHLRFIKHLIGYYKPLIKELHNYAEIINNMGLLVCVDPKSIGAIRRYNYVYTVGVNISGVNMSFKSGRFIDGFRLPGYTKRGIHNEKFLALHYLKQGFHSAIFNGGFVEHLERDSLSRPKNEISTFMTGVEWYLMPYGVYYYGFRININRLRFYEHLIKLYSVLRRTILSQAYTVGLKLAIEAIKNSYQPKDVRQRLLKIEDIEASKKIINITTSV